MQRSLILLRHAKAGDRDAWRGDDAERPLTRGGQRQALALAERLAGLAIARVLTSPYRRCRQTVEPLAGRLGLTLEMNESLREGASLEEALALIDGITANAVLCSHGDVIADLLDYLIAQRVLRPPLPATGKGAFWQIERSDGRFVAARLVAAP